MKPTPSLRERVTILEQKVEGLESLPARMTAVEWQIVQLRNDMHAGFSALREELGGEILGATGSVRDELHAEISSVRDELRAEINSVRDDLRAEISSVREELRAEIRAGDAETRRYMRVLHEDVIGRIAALQNGRNPHGTS